MGGYKVQGKEYASAKAILETARGLENAGCFSVVMECIPARLAQLITETVSIPTIGIGSGAGCDGQVLVTHDLLGLTLREKKPKFVRQYRTWKEDFITVIQEFKDDICKEDFPSKEESFIIDEKVIERLKEENG